MSESKSVRERLKQTPSIPGRSDPLGLGLWDYSSSFQLLMILVLFSLQFYF